MKMISKLQPGVFLIIIATLFVLVKAQVNLALHGTVKQETTYTDSAGISYTADLAIEGPANNNWEDGCSSTGFQSKTWWGLFLPRLAYITNVKSYYRKDEAHRMNDFRMFFANGSVFDRTEMCFRDTGKQAHNNLNQSIDCNLSPTRNIYYFNRNTFIELCYIEINGCWKGFWGENCTEPCPPTCIDQHCNPANGSCVWGCDSKNCMNRNCHKNTGACLDGCVLGRAGQYCNKWCSKGNFGWNCNATCDGCIVNECNHINGVCKIDSVCKPGFVYGKYCNEKCEAWHFGTNCNKICNCLQIPCNIFTGECSDDGCKKGWQGDACDQECVPGYFGYNCGFKCETCFNQSCDIIEGNCRVGCNDGYRGRKCDMPVSIESSAIIRLGFFVGGLASMCVVLFILWMVKNARRRMLKTKEIRQDIDNSHSNSDNQHYDDVMKMEGVSTYQDLEKQTVTESNDYDQINNAYGNL